MSFLLATALSRSALGQTEPPPPQPEDPGAAAKLEGFEVEAEGGHALRVGGLIQGDGRFFLTGSGTDSFLVRRARVDVTGKLARYFELRVHPDFAGSRVVLLDAFVNLHFIDEVQLRLGKGKPPFGLEHLQTPRDFLFPELGLPSLLLPNRDAGALLHGKLLDGAVLWGVGVFNGTPDGTVGEEDENDEKDVVARVFVHPFEPWKIPVAEGFGVGLAVTTGDQSGATAVHRTPGRQIFFAYPDTTLADGRRVRVSPQANFYFGPVGVFGEVVRTRERVSDGVEPAVVTSTAWQVAGSVVIGGTPAYGGTRVDAALDPERGTFGALELALRYGALEIDDEPFDDGLISRDASAAAARSFGAAVSWWFTGGARAHLAFDRTSFDGGAPGGADRSTEGVLVSRLSVGF
jgi:phosphate-selective porin OprO/OprP